jgi:hypothetical protein
MGSKNSWHLLLTTKWCAFAAIFSLITLLEGYLRLQGEIFPYDWDEGELPGVAATEALDDVLGALTFFEYIAGATNEDANGFHGEG